MVMNDFYIYDNTIRLHCRLEIPSGIEKCPLILLFHGLTGSMEDDHLPELAQGMLAGGNAVLCTDLYGHGKSGGSLYEHTLHHWLGNIEAVTAYAEKLDFVTELYLAGHSQGGLAAMLAAGTHPDKYQGILLFSPALVIMKGAKNGFLFGSTFDPACITEDLSFEGHALSPAYLLSAQSFNYDKTIYNYKGPVLLVHGDCDDIAPLQDSQEAVQKYLHAELKVIHGADHCFNDHIDEVTEVIRTFPVHKEKK